MEFPLGLQTALPLGYQLFILCDDEDVKRTGGKNDYVCRPVFDDKPVRANSWNDSKDFSLIIQAS